MYSCQVKGIPALIKHLKLLTNKVEFFKFKASVLKFQCSRGCNKLLIPDKNWYSLILLNIEWWEMKMTSHKTK